MDLWSPGKVTGPSPSCPQGPSAGSFGQRHLTEPLVHFQGTHPSRWPPLSLTFLLGDWVASHHDHSQEKVLLPGLAKLRLMHRATCLLQAHTQAAGQLHKAEGMRFASNSCSLTSNCHSSVPPGLRSSGRVATHSQTTAPSSPPAPHALSSSPALTEDPAPRCAEKKPGSRHHHTQVAHATPPRPPFQEGGASLSPAKGAQAFPGALDPKLLIFSRAWLLCPPPLWLHPTSILTHYSFSPLVYSPVLLDYCSAPSTVTSERAGTHLQPALLHILQLPSNPPPGPPDINSLRSGPPSSRPPPEVPNTGSQMLLWEPLIHWPPL